MKKLSAGIFDGPQIKEFMNDPMFSEAELSTGQLLKSVVANFLGNHWSTDYENEIKEILKNFRQLGAQMSVILNFLWSHLDYFPKNCEEQGERFHQDICIMK